MNIFDCDYGQAAGNCAYRLCWNLDYGIGGYRVGCTENLNSDSVWRKVMYKGNQVYSCVPGTLSNACNDTCGHHTCYIPQLLVHVFFRCTCT